MTAQKTRRYSGGMRHRRMLRKIRRATNARKRAEGKVVR